MLDLKKLFPNSKFPTVEELKTKEDTFSIGDRVKVANNIRCRQHGQIGTIVRIEPDDKHGWKSFIVKFDDEKYGAMGFQSGNIDKINEKETTMKKLNENQKVTLTLGQLKKLVNESMMTTDEEKRYFDKFASRLAASVTGTLKNMRELEEPENARTNANDFMHKLINTIHEFDVEALPRDLVDAAGDVIYNVFDKPA